MLSTNETTLDTLKPGEKAKILKVRVKGSSIRRKLFDMGMVAGSDIQLVRRAPLGDPLEFKIKGYNLSIRKQEAREIFVEIVE